MLLQRTRVSEAYMFKVPCWFINYKIVFTCNHSDSWRAEPTVNRGEKADSLKTPDGVKVTVVMGLFSTIVVKLARCSVITCTEKHMLTHFQWTRRQVEKHGEAHRFILLPTLIPGDSWLIPELGAVLYELGTDAAVSRVFSAAVDRCRGQSRGRGWRQLADCG